MHFIEQQQQQQHKKISFKTSMKKITMYIFTAQTHVLENFELYNILFGENNYFTCLKSFKTVFWLCPVKMNDALFSNHTFFFSKVITDSNCSTVNTILIALVLNYLMKNVRMRTKKMHKLQQSCGATLALKGTRCNCWKSATQTAGSTCLWKHIKKDQHRSIMGLLLLFC